MKIRTVSVYQDLVITSTMSLYRLSYTHVTLSVAKSLYNRSLHVILNGVKNPCNFGLKVRLSAPKTAWVGV